MDPTYEFRPAGPGDLPMLLAWRHTPDVLAWWGAWEEPEAECEAHLAEPAMALWIVSHDGRPFAFVQDYAVHAWEPHPFSYLAPGARGVDLYIGVPAMLGRGHGSTLLRALCDRLFAAGVPAIGTDPHPDNIRARRACEKAGFTAASGPVETRWGRAILMERRAPQPSHP
ncbi:MAG TPA: GNAT family N-acetyltransferase [Allosphingosinicella sp.]|jgi:aminoglycoside 6'-N-acetyltransferase